MKDETQTLSKTACPERKDRTPAAPVPGKSESALDGKKKEEKKPAWKTPRDSTAGPSDEKEKEKNPGEGKEEKKAKGETPTAMSPHAKEASGGKGPLRRHPREALKRTQSEVHTSS